MNLVGEGQTLGNCVTLGGFNCVDEDGLVFIVDWNNKRVQVF